jgi:cytochrome oxidase Cu insertion factor (SCO1/SenC/PrrC family)|tara:strand:+ start:2512 stop:2793 length:282 start_codon:yes stop_codon:yes gene_type:complete
MTEIVLKPELIKELQKVLVDYEPANEDPILAAQYLSAVVGSIIATSNLPKEQQDEILNQILDFIRYVYKQQIQDIPNQQPDNKQEAFGIWKPK